MPEPDASTRMRAAVHDRYGPPEVLRIEEVPRPTPAGDEVLVRVHATTVNRNDCHWRSGSPASTGRFGASGGLVNFASVPVTSRSRGRRAIFAVPAFSQPNVEYLAELMEVDAFRPVIDRTYPLDGIVEANHYVESERKTGNVVITIG